MQTTTYHIKAKEVNDNLMNSIRKLFQEDEDLTITVASEKKAKMQNKLAQKLLDLEKKYPPKQVSKGFDFNTVVDAGINL